MKDLGGLLVAAPVVVFVLVRFLWPGRQWRAAGLTLGLIIIPACASVGGISWRVWPRLGSAVEGVEHVHRQVVPGSRTAASLVWGAVYGLAGYGVDRLVRRRSRGSQVLRSVLVVSKEEVLAKDIGLVRAAVKGRSAELRELFCGLDRQEHSEKELARRAGRVTPLTNLVLTIHGYDQDAGPLWRYYGTDKHPEVRQWAWHLLEEMPYAIAFLEPQSALLLGLLCLGGLIESDYGGYIPDFKTDREEGNRFVALVRDTTARFMSHHPELPQGVYLAVQMKVTSILDQFDEMRRHLFG
ncbi:MAG TPA: hypothetical protein PLU87_19210 [Sedimentisphaerales bacterium]|nr:hypothetical protein [Sedimentisphaerales bacterium]HRV49835.1 hypothetical protein [Sedimentisphaerales bacterium]